LKSHAPVENSLNKIAVCGKGGVGKSTITVLLTNILAQKGSAFLHLIPMNLIPDFSGLFGFDKEPTPLISLLKRFHQVTAAMMQDGCRKRS